MFGFGKKVELDVPDGKGGIKKVKVSQREFDKWVAEGKITVFDECKVHVLDLDECYVDEYVIGKDISREEYNKFKDESGDLHMMVVYEKGEPQSYLMKKETWIEVKRTTSF